MRGLGGHLRCGGELPVQVREAGCIQVGPQQQVLLRQLLLPLQPGLLLPRLLRPLRADAAQGSASEAAGRHCVCYPYRVKSLVLLGV